MTYCALVGRKLLQNLSCKDNDKSGQFRFSGTHQGSEYPTIYCKNRFLLPNQWHQLLSNDHDMRVCRSGGPFLYTLWLNGGGHPQLHCKLPGGLHRKTISNTIEQLTECILSFHRVILSCLYREPQPKKPRGPHTAGPKPHQMETPTTQYKTPTPYQSIYLAWHFCTHPRKLLSCSQHNQPL